MKPPTNQFFTNASFASAVRELSSYQQQVEKDVRKLSSKKLRDFQEKFTKLGHEEITRLGQWYLEKTNRTGNEQAGILMDALAVRFKNRWDQSLRGYFGTAINSIDDQAVHNRQGRSIMQRIGDWLLGNKQVKPKPSEGMLAAVLRTQSDYSRLYRLRLVSAMKTLSRTLPANFVREADVELKRFDEYAKNVPRSKSLVKITNPGTVPESAQTCILCQGRVMTPDAFMFAQRWLSPNLFHPNCRHGIDRSFQQNTDTYDGKFGKILTLEDVQGFIGRDGVRKRKRPNPHITSL